MIIDSHGHVSAPPSLYAHWTIMEAAGTYHGKRNPFPIDDDLATWVDDHLAKLDEVGTDLQLVSPRPFILKHSHRPAQIVHWWVQANNDAVAASVDLHPDRFRGVAALPQVAGDPVHTTFDELDRCIDDLGFVGVLLNPDPSEGAGTTPVLSDEYWFPLFEKLVEKDVPALLHCAGCYGRENYSEHFISEESLAITSLIRGQTLDRFPDLKLIVPHGGGSVPYQLGRWTAHDEMFRAQGKETFLDGLRRLWFDTCLYTPAALSLLFDVVTPQRVLFGTEHPGSGGNLSDLKPVIEALPNVTDDDRADVFENTARTLYKRI